jgi:hypothetical protein
MSIFSVFHRSLQICNHRGRAPCRYPPALPTGRRRRGKRAHAGPSQRRGTRKVDGRRGLVDGRWKTANGESASQIANWKALHSVADTPPLSLAGDCRHSPLAYYEMRKSSAFFPLAQICSNGCTNSSGCPPRFAETTAAQPAHTCSYRPEAR